MDNQFSGKMIQEATGRTTNGVPINLDETTFDEVYGRIGMFKVGVGYRTTPRTEAVVNFVYSSESDEDEAIQIGTVGTPAGPAQGPLHLVPVLGLRGRPAVVLRTDALHALCRLPRRPQPAPGHPRHIRRRAVDVTPGLAAQDGKFFEKSWAFSLGPTAGLLIGVGPFEVMAETQLRFMGGLSDVDWLVEEGLRDINSESSRWSLPILVGARIRF